MDWVAVENKEGGQAEIWVGEIPGGMERGEGKGGLDRLGLGLG